MFGPREVLLTSDEPVVAPVPQRPPPRPDRHVRGKGQMADGRRAGHGRRRSPRRRRRGDRGRAAADPPTPGMPERAAVGRRQARVREIMHTLPPNAQEAIRDDLEGTHQYAGHDSPTTQTTARHRHREDVGPTRGVPVTESAELKAVLRRRGGTTSRRQAAFRRGVARVDGVG